MKFGTYNGMKCYKDLAAFKSRLTVPNNVIIIMMKIYFNGLKMYNSMQLKAAPWPSETRGLKRFLGLQTF